MKIEDKVYNTDLIIDELKNHPHTYESILKDCATPTLNVILRRKLSRLCKNNELCKSVIPGTRFGKVIIYLLDKKYKILVKNERIGITIYYFFDFKRINNYYIKVEELYELKGFDWVKLPTSKIFSCNDILKFI